MIGVIASFVLPYLRAIYNVARCVLEIRRQCLIVIGLYDTKAYRYALAKGEGLLTSLGELSAKHLIIELGFGAVLLFYYVVGLVLLVLG